MNCWYGYYASATVNAWPLVTQMVRKRTHNSATKTLDEVATKTQNWLHGAHNVNVQLAVTAAAATTW